MNVVNFLFQIIPKTFKPTILTFCVNKTAFIEKRQNLFRFVYPNIVGVFRLIRNYWIRFYYDMKELDRSRTRVLSGTAYLPRSQVCLILHIIRKPDKIIVLSFVQIRLTSKGMLTSIDFKFLSLFACRWANLGQKEMFSLADNL